MPRTTPVRATPTRAEPVAPTVQKKTRIRKNAAAQSMLDLPADIVALVRDQYGQDLQWVTDTILGKEEAAIRQSFEINAWEPVTPDMFGGVFDGMYMKKGTRGEINYQGLILMYRPYELTLEARQEENAARVGAMQAQESMIKGGVIPGLSAGFESNHPTAISRNVFSRSVHAPMDVPRD